MSTYGGAVALLVLGAVGVGCVYLLHRALTVSTAPLTALPFQSGWLPQEHALSRFHARWYPMTLLFLAFDVEMLFMYPWAVIVARAGPSTVVAMFAFLGVLLVAVVWAWREGALRWV